MFNVIPINDQTWLICGGRDFADTEIFDSAMSELVALQGMPARVVEGGAKGADSMARGWAQRHALDIVTEKAQWNVYRRSAGVIRNQAMLDKYKPDFVVAFPGGKGTADMVERGRKAGVNVAEIKENLNERNS